MKLLVRNLAKTSTEQDIRLWFNAYGTVAECTLVRDQETGHSKGFGFVVMPDEAEAKAAMQALNLTSQHKSKIRVKVAQS